MYGVRDVISGNGSSGIIISGSGTTGDAVEGDYIGLDTTGEYRLGNGIDGVDIAGGASSNLIGGPTRFARNVADQQRRRQHRLLRTLLGRVDPRRSVKEVEGVGLGATGARAPSARSRGFRKQSRHHRRESS